MGESLGVESGTEVGYSFGLPEEIVERKLEGSLGVFYRGASGARVDMTEGLLALGENVVVLEAEAARTSAQRLEVRYSGADGEDI